MKTKLFMTALLVGFSCSICNAQLPYLVKDINPGKPASNLRYMVAGNNGVYFSADDGENGTQLWQSDGSTSGTQSITNIIGGSPHLLTNYNDVLFFFAFDKASNEIGLWKTDGTNTGTLLIRNISPSQPPIVKNINGTLFFSAQSAEYGNELWKSDGTEQGTAMVKDITPGSTGSLIESIIDVEGMAYFSVVDMNNGYELWKSDGTENNTVKIVRFENWHKPSNFVNIKGVLYFGLYSGQYQCALYKSDGTTNGTVLVKNFPNGSGTLQSLVNANGTLFFAVNDNAYGIELWKSDGTEIGTTLVKDVYPGANSSSPKGIFNFDNKTIYFWAEGDSYHSALWKSDGTESGTTLVKAIYPNYITNFGEFTTVDNEMYFTITTQNRVELWKTNGLETGTVRVNFDGAGIEQLKFTNGKLFFTAANESTGRELWALQHTTGIDNSNTEPDNLISISPNPFDGSATITINADISDGAEFVLYDMLGKEVRRFEVSTLSFAIKRGELSDGVYTLQWLNGNNTISQRLVIMR